MFWFRATLTRMVERYPQPQGIGQGKNQRKTSVIFQQALFLAVPVALGLGRTLVVVLFTLGDVV